VLGAALAQGVFECLGVGVPERGFRVVPVADLPVAGGVVDACLGALELLLGINVQIKLEDVGAVVVEQLLEVVDVLVSRLAFSKSSATGGPALADRSSFVMCVPLMDRVGFSSL